MPITFSTVMDYAPTAGTTVVPVAVRLSNSSIDRIVLASQVTYSAVMPGGFERATITLATPLESHRPEIQHLTDCIVYDTRNLEVEFQGRLTVPGRGGLIQQITAEGGGLAHLEDQTKPVIYADQDLTRWARMDLNPQGGRDGVNESGDGRPVITLQFPQGLSVPVNGRVAVGYPYLAESGQRIARVAYSHRGGQSTGFDIELVVRTAGAGSSGTVVRDDTISTTESSVVADVYGTDWTDVRNWPEVRILRDAAVTIGDDNAWVAFFGLIVMGTRYNADSTIKTSGYTTSYVLAHQVFADLLGRLLTHCDGATAAIDETSTVQLDQLAYPDGATARQILDEIISLIGDWYYAFWEWTANSKWRAEFAQYPTTVGFYLRRADDQFDPPSGANPFNEADVRWISPAGRVKHTLRTAVVAALTAAGLTRTMRLDLGADAGSTAMANARGDVELAQSQTPTTGGRAVITRPLVDHATGRTLMPWQLPRHIVGKLVRVDIPPASLTATVERNGVDVLRVVRAEFDSSTAACTLELDAQFRFTARQAQLKRAVEGRRRR
jgi:hypothetical protein